MTDPRARTWMQTEWVRAAAVAGDEDDVEAACRALNTHHLDPAIPGGWVDTLSDRGENLATGMPASTLYHLVGCLVEVERRL